MNSTTRGRNWGNRFVRVPPHLEPCLRQVGQIATAHGATAFAVGGCVRDWLLGISRTPEVDVTVEGDGLLVAREVARTWGATAEFHQPFGTATLRLRQGPVARLDVASCRRETYARPAAYPRVEAGTLADDLLRRDFTINAMAIAVTPGSFGTLVDPYQGRGDLAGRRLRALHDTSFLDDPSRILRGIRFAERFGCRWERHTARRLRQAIAAGALGWLNAGRLRREFDLMLREPHPAACLRHLAQLLTTSRPGGRRVTPT